MATFQECKQFQTVVNLERGKFGLRVTTVLLPPAKGRSIDGDSRPPTSRGMPREVGRRIKTGENSRPTIGDNSTAAHKG